MQARDHGPFSYLAITQRPRLTLPGDARLSQGLSGHTTGALI